MVIQIAIPLPDICWVSTNVEEQVSSVFLGSVMLPGEEGPGLEASVEMGHDRVRMYTGDEELGTWQHDDFDVSPSGKGAFRLDVGGEQVYFTPSSPSKFAEAMEVPLQPEQSVDDKPKYDIDAAIDEAIANVKPLTSVNDDDDILSKPLFGAIVVVSGALMAGLAGMAAFL
jgi:hypothetical protein